MGFNFGIFPKFEVLPRFAYHPIFSGFLGTLWFVDLGDPFGYQLDHFCIFWYFGMHVASVLSILFSIGGLVSLYSLPVLLL